MSDTISATQFIREEQIGRVTEWRWRKNGVAPEHTVTQRLGRTYVEYTRESIDAWKASKSK